MKYKVLGIIFLVAIGAAVVSVLYYWQVAHQAIPGPIVHQDQLAYKNNEYGFSIALPQSWKGYTVISEQWEATNAVDKGPEIVLRHPLWTDINPREDMPILVLTTDQWQRMTVKKGFNIGAAPIQPSLLGQNSKYALALPARYNYDFKTGWEEVDQLVHTLKAFEPPFFCGGLAGTPCPTSGYVCVPEGNFPDAGTYCTKMETSDTSVWKTFESKELGIKFEYPADWGEIALEIKNGETFGYTSYPDQVKGKTFAAYYQPPGQNSRYALFGGVSSDFQTNRGGQFFDNTGYVKNPTGYYFKYIQTSKYLLDSKLVSEVAGLNTTGIFIDPITYVGMDWYYPWRYGAIFNLKSSKDFSGIAFELYIPNPDKDPDLPKKKLEFKKLLSTIEIK